MMRSIFIAAMFILLGVPAIAQFSVELSAGVGSYSMGDFKKFQTELKAQFPTRATITDEFPPYVFYDAAFKISHGLFFTGLSAAYGSTGGRVHYSDYSGYLNADQTLRFINLALPLGIVYSVTDNFTLAFDIRPTYTRSTARLRFEQQLGSELDKEELTFNSETFALQPGVAATRKIGSFGIVAQLYYYQAVKKGNLYLSDNDDAFLIGNNNKPLYAQWEGVRLSIGVVTFIGKQ